MVNTHPLDGEGGKRIPRKRCIDWGVLLLFLNFRFSFGPLLSASQLAFGYQTVRGRRVAHLVCSYEPRARRNTVPVLGEAIGMVTADEIVSRPLLGLANGHLSETLPAPSCSAVSSLAPVTSMPSSQRLGASDGPLVMHIPIRGIAPHRICMRKYLGREGVARQTPRRGHSLFPTLLSLFFFFYHFLSSLVPLSSPR